MTTADMLHETYSALSANKVRTGLTMLGIIIGISSVIAMIAIGNGAKDSIQSSIESIGSNLIMVMPGAERSFGGPQQARGSAETLTVADGEAIQSQIANVGAIAFDVTARAQVVAKGTNTNTSVIGTTPSYTSVRNLQVSEGNFFSESDVTSSNKVAVIGPTVASDLFADGSDPLGQQIRISSGIYTIIGVTASKGGSGFNNTDDTVYIPYTTAQHYLTGNQYLSEIDLSAASAEDTTQVQTDVTNLLLERHNISDPTKADFSTLNQSDVIATASSVTGTFTMLLAAVAGISLLVGGIGIMNMMLTTVTERTREIGLRKAIGAKKGDINLQFLIESVVLTFTGGVIGVILGWTVSFTLTKLDVIASSVTLSSILLAFGVSALIGIVFGYYPARRAANLNPIEALRFE
ncbi:MAG TPA: ABC transporter permease [Candidatus Paceibacterota bacterium]|nr:ABC transporter permease [Candidatus Paceibacterota bacterium]